jgi:hypothetical protein
MPGNATQRDVEEEFDEQRPLPRVISMRRKVALASFAYVCCVGMILLASSPGIMEAYTHLAETDVAGPYSEPPSHLETPPEQEGPPRSIGTNSDDGYVTLLRDDFEAAEDPWWYSQGNAGAAVRNGYLFLNLNKTTNISSFAELNENRLRDRQWLYVGMEVRLRCSDDNKLESEIGGGLRRWGLWDYKPTMQTFGVGASYLAFESYSPESAPDFAGLRAVSWVQTTPTTRKSLNEPITGIDITEWHTYTILWEEGNATFLVDGEVVATTSGAPTTPMAIDIRMSNVQIVYYKPGEHWDDVPKPVPLDLDVDEWIQVDYVHLLWSAETHNDRSEEMSQLFSEAEEAIDSMEQKNMDTQKIRESYTEATDAWDKYYYTTAKKHLEEISGISRKWDELSPLFSDAEDVIARGQGRGEDTEGVEAQYAEAVDAWETALRLPIYFEHYSKTAKTFLEDSIAWGEITELDMFSRAEAAIEEAKKAGHNRLAAMETYYTRAVDDWNQQEDYNNVKTNLQQIIDTIPEPTFLAFLALILLPALLRRRSRSRTCE